MANMELAGRTAFTFINLDGPMDNPGPYIHSVLFTVAPTIHYRLIPSSRGHMLLRFDSKADSDAVASLSPIIHNGTRLTLERSEETSNHFILEQS